MTQSTTLSDDLSFSESTEPTVSNDDFAEAMAETLFDNFDNGYYIGMMSGTSLDGMDAVICQFKATDHRDDDANSNITDTPQNKIIATHTKVFSPPLRNVLLALCQPNGTSRLNEPAKNLMLEQQPQSELEWFGWASAEYAQFASTVVEELLEKSGMSAESILAIGCHGQTVRHHPHLRFTLQLVDPNIIAERTGISVVSDFRRRDMAVGGQGAPLAPAFHLAQFGEHTSTSSTACSANRIVVNLGGIANITVLPAEEPDNVIGYDTGPANILLDGWYQTHAPDNILQTTPLYDEGGHWAQTGTVHDALLHQLRSHSYFSQPAPKSTGREDFNLTWLTEQIAKIGYDPDNQPIRNEDVQATLTALTVTTLADAIMTEAKRLNLDAGNIIVCGGGAYNTYLLSQLADALPNWQVLTSEDSGIAPTWVEAMAFAWLARQTLMGEIGNLPAVTGASKAVVLGQVCFA